ncbi:MAG: hypothetical protein NZ920_02920 [Aigarchaeota archaeon]|nr:hypothetical protein [Aigarchaeota archaeon]MDW8092425.1 hypothetical protein [Nitrososphaerota archaeon]
MTDFVRAGDLVVPGDEISDEVKRGGRNTYLLSGRVRASVFGVVVERNNKFEVIAVKGVYKPSKGDYVIGVVKDVKPNVIEVDLGEHIVATLRPSSQRRRTERLSIGDVIYARVKYSGLRGVILEYDASLRKIEKGLLVRVNPVVVAGLLDKRHGLLNVIRSEAGCNVNVGMNGVLVISGPSVDSELAVLSAIRSMEEDFTSPDLVDRVVAQLRRSLIVEVEGDEGGGDE